MGANVSVSMNPTRLSNSDFGSDGVGGSHPLNPCGAEFEHVKFLGVKSHCNGGRITKHTGVS